MQISIRTLVNEVIGYSVGAAVNRILAIFVACIYPILLSRDEYGRVDVIFSVPNLLSVVFFIGLDTALARFYYEHEAEAQRRSLVSTVFYTVMGFTAIAVGILLVVSKPMALWLYREPRYILYFRLALIAMPFAMASSMQSVVLRLERRVHAFNLITIGNLVTASAISISCILLFKIGAAGMLIGFIAGSIATAAAGMYMNRRQIFASPAMGKLRELLGIGLPLVVSGVALWLIGYVNRPILVHRVSPHDLGVYAIASGGVNMMALIIGAFRNAWQPFAFSIMGHEGAENVYGRTLTLFTALSATVAACATLFTPEALLIINAYTHKNWSAAAPAFGPLALGLLFSAMYFIIQTGIYIARRTSIIAVTISAAAAINILLNFALIPRFGIVGAAWATGLGHLAALVGLYVMAQRILPMPYQRGKLMTIVLLTAVVVILAPHLNIGSIIQNLLLKAVLAAAYCVALLATRAIALSDLALFWNTDWRRQRSAP
jgi:O-antigen/teichoic acid export membrane protein